MKIRPILMATAVALAGLTAQADDVAPANAALTLKEAMQRALQANPQARAARAEVEAAEAQRRLFRSAILPQLEFSGSSTTNAEEVSVDFDGQRATIIPQNDYAYSISLRQPLYAGGRELKTIRQAGIAIEGARAGVRQTEDQLLLQTATAYLAALEGAALVEVERSNLALAESRRKQARDFFDAGEVTQVDVLRAETAVKGAERRLASAVEVRDVALSRLRIALAIDGPVRVERARITLPELPLEEQLMAQAVAKRAEVQQAALSRRSAEIEVSKQRAARLPVLTAEATARTQRADFPSDHTGAFMVNLTLPIFDSGAIGSRVAVATERKKQAEYALEQAQREVREDVRQALIGLRSAQTNLELAGEQLAAAQAEYEQTFELYRAQEATSLDVAAAETALSEARRAVASGTMDRDLAELRVWYATGALKDVLITEERQ